MRWRGYRGVVNRLVLLFVGAAGCSFHTNAAPAASDVDASSGGEPVATDAAIDPAVDARVDAPADATVWMDAPPVAGSIVVAVASFGSGDAKLSNEGTTDWAHWGLGGAGGFDHKSSGGGAITDASATTTKLAIQNVTATASWNDGTPHATANATGTGVGVQEPGALTFTVPAGVQPRTLHLYCGNKSSTARLDLALSDGSAVAYTDTQTAGGTALHLEYTIVYNAASDGQTLTVTWTDANDNVGGFAMLLSASLQ